MSSITNQIIANIKKTSTNFKNSSFTNSENVVCIDTSLNRIGINKKNPIYSIDISGERDHHAIRVHRSINNYGIINTISSNFIDTQDLSAIVIDVSYQKFKLLSGHTIDISLLLVSDISMSNSILNIPTIESETINSNKLNASIIEVSNLKVSISGEIQKLSIIDTLNVDNIISNEISNNYVINTNKLNVLEDLSTNSLNANSIFCENEISCNAIHVDNAYISEILETITLSCNIITTLTISCNEINVAGVNIFDNQIIECNEILANSGSIDDLSLGTLDISLSLHNIGVTNLSNGTLILPQHNYNNYPFDNPRDNPPENGSLNFDKLKNNLQVFNNDSWGNILIYNNYAYINLNNDISGNDISYNHSKKAYFIENSNNLILTDSNYKYIPITLSDVSNGNKFDISNNSKSIIIDNLSSNNVFEIHASVGIKYLNKHPGDVEPNIYTFGIYPNMSTHNDISSINGCFANLTNTVISFDNSYNYSNTSLNYIGKLDIDNNHSGYNFYISSSKDINFIVIDKFYGTIKQI